MRPVLLQRKLHIVAFFLVIFIIVLFFNHQENSPKKGLFLQQKPFNVTH